MPPNVEPQESRQFAIEVVERLRHEGFESLWAGGCVRDQLLGRTPKDYDVATNATPAQIREVFGHRRTLAIGAAFGVITVLGRKSAGPIEVATFRCDAQYSDGRHPDSVRFSTAEEDAQRRDFTINGLFYDPLAEQVIDYVGGQADLKLQRIRAIRNPFERFAEDKLRMLRAVRFAATFDFEIEPQTFAAVQQQAAELVIVSAERIATELRRMLVHSNRRRAIELLRESRLLSVILPEASVFDDELGFVPDKNGAGDGNKWQSMLQAATLLNQPSFATALTVLLRNVMPAGLPVTVSAEKICKRWKLANEETEIVSWLLQHESAIRRAPELPWPTLQRILISESIAELLCYGEAISKTLDGSSAAIQFCREKLKLPRELLDPEPLVTGNSLKESGLRPGPAFKLLLEKVRDAQLERKVTTVVEALELARRLAVELGLS